MNNRLRMVGAAGLCVAVLSGCGVESPLSNTSWQVADVYTSPEYPSTVPDSIAGLVSINFGNTTISGFTGCVPLQGIVSFYQDASEKSSSPGDPATEVKADILRVDSIEFDEVNEENCTGHAQFIHDAMVEFFKASEYSLTRPSDHEVILTVRSSDPQARFLEQPAVRLVSSQS